MKKQKIKFNKSKLAARVMLVILLITSAVGLFGCYFGSEVDYGWHVETHEEFLQEIEEFNSVNDGAVNTFISFDLDSNEVVSDAYYELSTRANNAIIGEFGLHDKVCNLSITIIYYLKSEIENDDHNEHAYKINIGYGGYHKFSEQDKIEIRQNMSPNCAGMWEDAWYMEEGYLDTSKGEYMIYKNAYHYNIFVNDTPIACIHISSIEEASEEKLEEIINMLSDSMVIINTEG